MSLPSLVLRSSRSRTFVAMAAAVAIILILRRRSRRPAPKPIEYAVAVRPEGGRERRAYLVTGGAGMLGGQILLQLRKQYPTSKLLSLDLGVPPPQRRIEGVIYVRCDLANADHLEHAFAEALADDCVIESVLHIAAVLPTAQTMWSTFELVNVKGTATLVDKSLEKGARAFIYCSSVTAVLDLKRPVLDGVVGESLPYPQEYVDLYARSKALGEMEVLKRNGNLNSRGQPLTTCAIRVCGVVDANDKAFGQNLPRGYNNVYFGRGTNVIDWVWSVDVAWCFVAATKAVVERPQDVAGKPFHVGGFTKAIALKDWISFPDPKKPEQSLWGNIYPSVPIPGWVIRNAGVLNALGVKVLGFAPIDPMLRPDTIRVTDGTLSWWWDLSAAKSAFGYEPTPVEKVIELVRDEALGLLSRAEAAECRGPGKAAMV